MNRRIDQIFDKLGIERAYRGGNRSFKASIEPPEGMSYAGDIAAKYGVTFDMLMGN